MTIRIKSDPAFRTGPLRIKRSLKPYWEENGWIRSPRGLGFSYHGRYKISLLTDFQGLIEEYRLPTELRFYIYEPTGKILDHPEHGACFNNHKGGGKFFIHFSRQPRDIDSGIIHIERIIHEIYFGF